MAGWMQTAFLVFFGAIAIAVLPGCDTEAAIDLLERTAQAPTPPTASIPSTRRADEPVAIERPAVSRDRSMLRIGSFNIQAFGPTKASRPQSMAVLADLLTRFDIVAVQEIRSKDQSVFESLMAQVNQAATEKGMSGSRFEFLVGPRLGRTVSTEQYAYVWDSSRVELLPESVYTLRDTYDDFHREPLVATFQTRSTSGPQPFRFTLINIHTDPDLIDWELDRLDDLLRVIAASPAGEDDLILLGDLNADDTHLGELGQMRHVIPLLRATATNTRKTKMYDNLIVHRIYTSEWTGRSGVIDFPIEYRLDRETALQVSDHLPVWADFYPHENAGQILATEPGGVVR